MEKRQNMEQCKWNMEKSSRLEQCKWNMEKGDLDGRLYRIL